MLAAHHEVNNKLPSNVIQISLERLMLSSHLLARDFLDPFLGDVTASDHANCGILADFYDWRRSQRTGLPHAQTNARSDTTI